MENNNENIKIEFEKLFEKYICDLYKEFMLSYFIFVKKIDDDDYNKLINDIILNRRDFYMFLRKNFIIFYFDYLQSLSEDYFFNIIDKNLNKIKAEINNEVTNIDNEIFESAKDIVKKVVVGFIIPGKIYNKSF